MSRGPDFSLLHIVGALQKFLLVAHREKGFHLRGFAAFSFFFRFGPVVCLGDSSRFKKSDPCPGFSRLSLTFSNLYKITLAKKQINENK